MFTEVLLFTLSVTAPIFGWLLLGTGLKNLGLLNEQWISRGSWFVFYVSLPVLMFTSMVRQPVSEVFLPTLFIVCCVSTFLILGVSRWWSITSKLAPENATVMQQGALRGNLGIIGLLLCIHAYGEGVLTQVSLLMAMLTIVYNVVSVYVFVDGLNEGRLNLKLLIISLLKNPLIVAILVSLPLAVANVRLAPTLFQWTDGFVTVTLPIALVCIGGTLSYRSVKGDLSLLLKTASLKLILMPVVALALLLALGVEGQQLGMVFLLMASPTAAASFVMTKAYGGNASLAANIVVFTTLGSLLTISFGVFVLTYLQLM